MSESVTSLVIRATCWFLAVIRQKITITTTVTRPKIRDTFPKLRVALPKIRVTLPTIRVTLPKIWVALPKIRVALVWK